LVGVGYGLVALISAGLVFARYLQYVRHADGCRRVQRHVGWRRLDARAVHLLPHRQSVKFCVFQHELKPCPSTNTVRVWGEFPEIAQKMEAG
jgi:hypothetical protein